MIIFLLGAVVGAVLTILCMGMCAVASDADKREKEMWEKHNDTGRTSGRS